MSGSQPYIVLELVPLSVYPNTIPVITYPDTRERLWTLSKLKSPVTVVKKKSAGGHHVYLTLTDNLVSQCAEFQ